MPYTALYRKFRPKDFDDVKGQEHVVETLKNEVRFGRIGHAYLFCGTRGTGKTTVAKILAKAVNCENPVDGGPCNKCAMCQKIDAQTSMNVVEIDAASNNGVANIRDIIDEVQYSPTEGRYKVYIIDEVHMLSIGAFNALLKTLEEPPPYVIFILATTEAHKIPVTILSRCQRYDFRRISADVIERRLKELVGREGVKAQDMALRYIAKAADGSLRDALSLLDQCIAFYMGQPLTYDGVLDALGAADERVYSEMVNYIADFDVKSCLETLDEMMASGKDLEQFVNGLAWHMRDLLLIDCGAADGGLIDASSEQLDAMRKEAKKMSQETLMRHIRVLSELSNRVRKESQKRTLVEIALIKMCRPQMDLEPDISSIVARLDAIEKRIEKGTAPAPAPASLTDGEKKDAPKQLKGPRDIIQCWNDAVSRCGRVERDMLLNAEAIPSDDGGLILQFTNSVDEGYFKQDGGRQLEALKAMVSGAAGRDVPIRTRTVEEHGGAAFEDLSSIIHFDDVEYK